MKMFCIVSDPSIVESKILTLLDYFKDIFITGMKAGLNFSKHELFGEHLGGTCCKELWDSHWNHPLGDSAT